MLSNVSLLYTTGHGVYFLLLGLCFYFQQNGHWPSKSFPSPSLESNNRWQFFMLGVFQSRTVQENMVTGGSQVTHQHPCSEQFGWLCNTGPSFLRGHPIREQLDCAKAGDYIRHWGGTRSLAALKEANQLMLLAKTRCQVISAVHITELGNWKADYLSGHHLDQWKWALQPDIFNLMSERENSGCLHPSL